MKIPAIISCLFLVLALNSMGQNNYPVAVNDTVSGFIGYPVQVTSSFLLRNDYDPDGDSIYINAVNGFQRINDTTWERLLIEGYPIGPYDSIISNPYFLKDQNGGIDLGKIIIRIRSAARYDSLDVNNINALISPFGNHFWNLKDSHFEVPKGSGKKAVFSQSLWMGGMDEGGSLSLAAERYRSGTDYWTGPISYVYDSSYTLKWNRVWKVDKEEIRFHSRNWNTPGYVPIDAIKYWPGNGDVSLGQSQQIAPFYDVNADGIYDPLNGDYPLIRGDQAIFFIFNDARSIHTESKGQPLGIEIHGMAYEYDLPDDSTLYNTLFMHYDIINLSAHNYNNTYLGLFGDFEIGYANDDYIGSDVTNGMMYEYNGTAVDGTGQPWAYGVNPPAIDLKIIGGPLLPPDGIDNPAGACGYSLNGLNFGDGIADNERMGMTNFVYTNNNSSGIPWYMTDPAIAPEYYALMRSIWNDGTHMIYGGNGHISSGGLGPECNFMFPGNSDTICNYGTNGVLPNGGFNRNGYYWTDSTALNAPEDRRGVASVGPFSFTAGESVPLDYCLTFARDYSRSSTSSVNLLRERNAELKPLLSSLVALPSTYNGIEENKCDNILKIYPNPATNHVFVESDLNHKTAYQLYDLTGKLITSGYLLPGKNTLNISHFQNGVYILKCGMYIARIVKIG